MNLSGRISIQKILLFLILVALPFLVWVLVSQRLEIRQKATGLPSCPSGFIASGDACLIGPTTTPGPTPTCVPRPACLDATPPCLIPITSNMCPPPPPTCQRGTPFVTVDRQNQSATGGSSLTYLITFKNTDSDSCGPTTFQLAVTPVRTGWGWSLPSSINLGSQTTTTFPVTISSPPGATPATYDLYVSVFGVAPTHAMNIPISYTVTASPSVNLEFWVKFAGVTDMRANGATASIRFVKGNLDLITPPVPFSYVGNGVYDAKVSLPASQLPPGDGYTIIVKGEKHVAIKFCQPAGQTTMCQPYQTMAVPQSGNFDFTGLPLPPGDLPPQDGKVDQNDFSSLKNLTGISCSSLTPAQKFTGDLNYDGCVDVLDAFLLRQTLEARYDQN